MNQLKLIIVEDDPMVVEIAREFVKEDPDFVTIGTAGLGKTAVELIKSSRPDLVLLDYCLPDFNGSEVIKQVRTFNQEVDFIVITAVRDVPLVQECLRLGIRDYLIKPYLKQRFLQALQNYKQFQSTLAKETICQADLDRLSAIKTNETHSSKGFSDITEAKIIEIVKTKGTAGITAEEVAAEVGVTPVSARRYLNRLQDKQMIYSDLIYGKQGRPTSLFRPAP